MAREAGLVIDDLVGTGPGGRIVRADVAKALSADQAKQPLSVTRLTVAPPVPASAPVVQAADYVDIPHSRIRRAIAAGLTESKRSAPHFYVSGVANVGKLMKLREKINADSATRVSVNDLIVLAVARAHTRVPKMNVIWTEDAVRQFASVDVAVAVATEDGLVTPVVRGADRMSILTLAVTTKDFAERARAGRLRPDELSGGTVSVSNLGMFGTVEFTAIINPPQASILAVGAVTEAPAIVKGKLRTVRQLRVTLSVDHRPVDGAVAAQWMRAFTDLLENPLQVLL
jgi:pyruvate dehydrogenase E2 component (dihydrolipoamide acetyltransferase)